MPESAWTLQRFPEGAHYWLHNARVPLAFLTELDSFQTPHASLEGALVDLEIQAGRIARIQPSGSELHQAPAWDLQGGHVWPCFVDLHTHLDKGQIWGRSPNPDGRFTSALQTCIADATHWTATDLYRRMDFGLRCSYAHGTQALRTHLDAAGTLAALSFGVFRQLQQEWAGRMSLQAACLVPLEYYLTPEGEQLADFVAESGGILGGVSWPHPDLERQIDRLLALAQERGLALDLHVDESQNPQERSLAAIAAGILRTGFTQPVVCGHCCSLAVQDAQVMEQTIASVRAAGIGIVSLPMVNLYLQDRQTGHTPRWRGIAPVQELHHAGVPVAFASDNCRDPFHALGDHDGWEVFREAVRMAHLDQPYGDWVASVTQIPASLMGLPHLARLGPGQPADLILFRGRSYSELLARSQTDRIVLRQGRPIDTTLPDYSELDDLMTD
jgi:cytosine/creatinine deaminase